MQRTIVAAAELPEAALDQLKQWLAIRHRLMTPRLSISCAPRWRCARRSPGRCRSPAPARRSSRERRVAGAFHPPVQSIAGIEGIPAEGARFALEPEAYAIDLAAEARAGPGRPRIGAMRAGSRCASSPGSPRRGRICPRACATGSSGSPRIIGGCATAPPTPARRPRSPRCGVPGGGCGCDRPDDPRAGEAGTTGIVARLAAQARVLAQARIRAAPRRAPLAQPALLWPLFGDR